MLKEVSQARARVGVEDNFSKINDNFFCEISVKDLKTIIKNTGLLN